MSLAQGGMKTTISMGPVGPQLMMQLEGPAPTSNVHLESESEKKKKHHASAKANDDA